MVKNSLRNLTALLAGLLFIFVMVTAVTAASGIDFSSYEWTEVNEDAAWSPRAGLQVVELRNQFYLMGGRTPNPPSFPPIPGDSQIWGDVWKSNDQGASWDKILNTDDTTHWPARAYFQAVTHRSYMYVLGGQNFKVIDNPDCPPFPSECPPQISVSDFFNDVWRSRDGVTWQQMTDDADWAGRAGLSSVVFKGEIFVLGGSFNDDPAIIGGPPTRVYFNDVWKSRDGSNWELMTDSAPWAPRAGAAVVTKNGYMYLLGGEDGFVCEPLPFCDPPYFNDVWRSRDGANWELVTEEAEWTARPGHQAAVLKDNIVLFGGFGLITNPMDVWVSKDGANWVQVSDSPWNAAEPDDIKYDFDVLVSKGARGGLGPSIFTFGGDRETFDFTNPTNYLRVDNDVWRFSPQNPG